jgi:hypothetical protein
MGCLPQSEWAVYRDHSPPGIITLFERVGAQAGGCFSHRRTIDRRLSKRGANAGGVLPHRNDNDIGAMIATHWVYRPPLNETTKMKATAHEYHEQYEPYGRMDEWVERRRDVVRVSARDPGTAGYRDSQAFQEVIVSSAPPRSEPLSKSANLYCSNHEDCRAQGRSFFRK